MTKGNNFICVCRGEGGNPPADVTWYKGNEQIATGTVIAILNLTDVDKNDAETYKCEAKSHEKAKKETTIEIIVNCKYRCIIVFYLKQKNNTFYVAVNYSSPIMQIDQSDYFTCESQYKGAMANIGMYRIPIPVSDRYPAPSGIRQSSMGNGKVSHEKKKQILRLPNVNTDNNCNVHIRIVKSNEKANVVATIELIVTYNIYRY